MTHPSVNEFINGVKRWKNEMVLLRDILSTCKLEEDFKWGNPCYKLGDCNIVLIHAFKDYCALLFFKGALLKDPKSILVQQTKNVQSARQLRFTNTQEIKSNENNIRKFVKEAIKNEKAGLKVPFKKTDEFECPAEFKQAMKENATLKSSFYALTPGRQKAYLLFFSSAKQSKTRHERISKYYNKILDGKGLND